MDRELPEGRASISGLFERNSPPTALAKIGERHRNLLSYCFCIAAGLCATYLSGLNFPEKNNHWHIPIAFDFAGSAAPRIGIWLGTDWQCCGCLRDVPHRGDNSRCINR